MGIKRISAAALMAVCLAALSGTAAFASSATDLGYVDSGPGVGLEETSPGVYGESTLGDAGMAQGGTSQNVQGTGGGQADDGLIGPGETAPSQQEGQQQAQTDPAYEPAAVEVRSTANIYGLGLRQDVPDHTAIKAPQNSFITALALNLSGVPEGRELGISYSVNLSGSGWLPEASNGMGAGSQDGTTPLEGVKLWLTGQDQAYYDICYQVLQNGSWTGWVRNGAEAGNVGVGAFIQGFAAAVVRKGAEAPELNEGTAVDPSKPMIALTFDDGPSASVTGRILNALEQNGGRATFFVVGSRVQSNAASILRAYQLGCEIGNHTYGHKYISKLSADGIRSELATTNQLVANVTGVSPVLMRPPGGFYDSASLGTVGELGMSAIMWSIDTRDWQHRNAQKTIDNVLSQVKDGDIILMHDLYTASAEAAEYLIPELTRRGYQLVTVSELAAYRGGLAPGHVYSRFRP